MNLEDYTLEFINLHQNGMLSEEEVNDFINEGLYDEEILESYILHLEEQEEIYQAYLNGEIDDVTISDLMENEYFNNDYADLLIEASLSNMIKDASRKAPIFGKTLRLIDADRKRPELRKRIIGNPNFQQSKLNKADHIAGAVVRNTPKVIGHLWRNKKKYIAAGLAAGALHAYTLHGGEADLKDYKAKTEKYNSLVKDKNESHWYNPASWGAPSQEKIDNAKKEMLNAEDKARGNWYYRMVKGKLKDGSTVGSITDSRAKE